MMAMLVGVVLVGKEIAGARSWFQIGSVSLQPSEFAKFAACLALAKYLSKIDLKVDKLSTRITAATIIIIPALLIILQPDMGSAMVFAALILVLFREGLSGNLILFGVIVAFLFILALLLNRFILIGLLVANAVLVFILFKNLRKKWFWIVGSVIVSLSLCITVLIMLLKISLNHIRKKGSMYFWESKTDIHGAGYNVHQSKIAIGSGGFSGKGFLKGTQTKFDFVPEQSTDFIFCTIGEEWGFLGSFFIVIVFVSLLTRIIILAERQRSRFSRIYGYGVASIIFFHFVVNIGMTIGLFPVIGIPLPFISYGGSSLWGFTVLLFIFIKLDSVRLELL